MTLHPEQLLSQHPLVSSQVSKEQVSTILAELSRVMEQGVPGAVVEFGCYIGTTSLFLRRLLDTYHDDREFHVYDSFAGLPPKTAQDESRAGDQFQAGELAVSKKDFVQQFKRANLRLPIVHKAWFKHLTPQDVPAKVAFAFLDGDFYQSIRGSLRLVLPRMVPGAIIVIDDYAREALPGPAKAIHDLLPGHTVITHHNLGIIRL